MHKLKEEMEKISHANESGVAIRILSKIDFNVKFTEGRL